LEEEYYLRDLTVNDWEKFNEMEKEIFPEEPIREESFRNGLSSLRALSMVMIHKETKEFIGYYRIGIYGNLGHIYRIGVHPNYRRKGYGSILLEKSMFQLKKAGCNKFFLYVKEYNEAAINLYRKFHYDIETKSWQFIIPYKKLPQEPRGRCRHIEWGEIQLMTLRFNLNPHQIQQYFTRENQHVMIYENMGQQLGFCRFDPTFPGAMPFIIKDPEYVLDFVSILKSYIINPEFDSVKITFDGQENLVNKLVKGKFKINYNLLRMNRPVKIEDG